MLTWVWIGASVPVQKIRGRRSDLDVEELGIWGPKNWSFKSSPGGVSVQHAGPAVVVRNAGGVDLQRNQ